MSPLKLQVESSPASQPALKVTQASEPQWVQDLITAEKNDLRKQPWKEALGDTHDKGYEGEDLINLQLPNHVQCGSLAA
jgi:hypothetical protein